MKSSRLTCAISIAALAIASVAAFGDDDKRHAHRDFGENVQSLDKEIQRTHSENDALHVVSVETGVPRAKLDQILAHRPNAGPAGIMVACTIADYTKRDPDFYMDRHYHDKVPWSRLLDEAGVPPEKVDSRLSRMDRFAHAAPERPREERR